MMILRKQLFVALALTMCWCRHITAEVGNESQTSASLVLSKHFDTVGYTSMDVLSRLMKASASEPTSDMKPALPLVLRLPFVQLIGGSRILDKGTMADLQRNYAGVLVGATDFTPPSGLGMVASLDCYIAILRPEGKALSDGAFRRAAVISIDTTRVWTWSAPPYEGHPQQTAFYAGEIGNEYFVLSNDLDRFTETIRSLKSAIAAKNPATLHAATSSSGYWLRRSIQAGDLKTNSQGIRTATGVNHSPLILSFEADTDGMKCLLAVDGAIGLTDTSRRELTGTDVLHYTATTDGTLEATVPLSQDPGTTTALFTVFSLLGFGVSL